MRIGKLLTATVIATGLLATCFAGCSETKDRAAGRKLSQQSDVARRLCARALSLMSDAPFLVGGTSAPFAAQGDRKLTAADVTVLPGQSINPRAMDALKEAETKLSAVIAEVQADASPADLASARQAMAKVFELKSSYYAMEAAAAGRAVDRSLEAARDAVAMMGALKGIGQYYEKLLSMSDAQLQQEKQQVDAKSKDAASREAAAAGNVKKVEGQLAALLGDREKGASEIQRMTREAQDLAADKALELNEKIDAVRQKNNELTDAALKKDTELTQARQAQRDVSLESASLKARADAIASVVKGRSTQADLTTKTREALNKAVGDQVKVVSDALAAAAAEVKKFGDASASARKECDAAIQQLQGTEALGSKTFLPAARAAAHFRMGQLWLSEGRLASRVAAIVAEAEAALPKDAQVAALDGLKSGSAEHEKTAARSADDFDKAIRQYEVAQSAAARADKWSYSGNLAMAYLAKAQAVQGRDREAAIKSAIEAKEAAVSGSGKSDTVFAAELQRAIDAATGAKPEAPTSAPAGT